ncbi:MAG TPA: hypothetical protein VKI61_19330 [Chitinophagaceae bacterium]|jgi:hypothetical protein|nr:hypothetical protein [Chitinophagaceae bacterium]
MKQIILAVFLIAGASTLHAQDSTKHKMKADTMHHKMMKADTSMHHKMMKSKMKKDSTK